MLDISVFNVAYRKATVPRTLYPPDQRWIERGNYTERTRTAQIEGYQKAVVQLIPQLNSEIESFREPLRAAVAIKQEPQPGYKVREVRK